MDELRIELGYALLPLINGGGAEGDQLTEQIKALRRQIAGDMGFVMPPVRILDNIQLGANDYVIKVKEVEAGARSDIPRASYMVMDPQGGQVNLPGTHTTEPTFGLPATWVDGAVPGRRGAARLYRGRSGDRAFNASHRNPQAPMWPNSCRYADVQKLLKELPAEQGKLVEDLVPSQITVSGIQRVLQALLNERISDSRSCAPSWKASPK